MLPDLRGDLAFDETREGVEQVEGLAGQASELDVVDDRRRKVPAVDAALDEAALKLCSVLACPAGHVGAPRVVATIPPPGDGECLPEPGSCMKSARWQVIMRPLKCACRKVISCAS